MAYQVNKTDGTLLTTIFDGQTDSPTSPNGHSSLTLIGKQVANFGELQNENFIHLLENFSNSTDPVFPLEGQLWWDKTTKSMNVFNGTSWHAATGFTVLSTAPSTPLIGDQWWDTTNDQYKVYNGTDWVTIGPVFSKLDGKAGALVENIYDTGASRHAVIKLYHDGNVTAIISRDAEFTPNVSIDGFTTVKPGISFSSNVADIKLYGTATNADTLGNIASSQYLRSDVDTVSTANVSITQHLTVGPSSELDISVTGNKVALKNTANNGNVTIVANVSSVLTNAILVDGSTGLVYVTANPVGALGVATKQYTDSLVNSLGNTLSTALLSNVTAINNSIDFNVNMLEAAIAATNDAVAIRAPLNSPEFTGAPTAPNPSQDDSSTRIATTSFVANSISSFDTTRLYNSLSQVKVNTNNVVVTANATTVATFSSTGMTTITQAANDNSTRAATTAYVDTATKNFILNSAAYKPTCYVTQSAPDNGTGNDGDFWFQYH
jgi:hypothetical protein